MQRPRAEFEPAAMARVVGVSVELAERAVDQVAGYAEVVAPWAVGGGFGSG